MLEEKEDYDYSKIQQATESCLNDMLDSFLNIHDDCRTNCITDAEKNLVDYVLSSIEIDKDSGRLIMPALWKREIAHLLSPNFNLAKSILNSQRKKLSPAKLNEYDGIIKQQLNDGIIECVDDIATYARKHEVSFLAHNAVFRENVESTKCRVVFLSNLGERSGARSLSHNQCSLVGPNLNHKLQVATLLLRFDKFLMTFDLKKAFLQLMLQREDTEKLLFLWFKDISRKDFSIVGYRFCRVPFGMRYSPFLLMLGLYYILLHNVDNENPENLEIRKALYDLSYMDNLSYTSNNEASLFKAYNLATEVFNKYKFELQQFTSNSPRFNEHLSSQSDGRSEKFFGLLWNTKNDTLRTHKLHLDPKANTKRKILSTLQSNFDPFGINIPVLNRARLFLHALQIDNNIGWDDFLTPEQRREWDKISKQVNKSNEVIINRSVGDRERTYNLVVYADASREFLGCAVYLNEVNSSKTNLILAKNSVLSKNLRTKSIPVLELIALHFAVKVVLDLYENFCAAVRPVKINKIYAFTDSMIALNWIKSKEFDFGKIEKKNVLVNNKLNDISDLCTKHSVIFSHIDGAQNPADVLTRCISEKTLRNTCFLTGPKFTDKISELKVRVPHPDQKPVYSCPVEVTSFHVEPVFPLNKFSSFSQALDVLSFVFKFVNKLKLKVKCRRNEVLPKPDNEYLRSFKYLISKAQVSTFGSAYESLLRGEYTDPLVVQMNLFLDEDKIIRVQSKLKNLKASYNEKCPILLAKDCPIAKSIIWDVHNKMGHSGLYKTLSSLRKHFWIVNGFVTVKNILQECFICKMLNSHSIKVNQNAYKNFRINPEAIPFRNICVDHCGPFLVTDGLKQKCKVYVLVISCLWSRAVNLVICRSMEKSSFLRALQVHIFENGFPSLIISDNGSPIVAGVEQTASYLNDTESVKFLKKHNINTLKFHPYPANSPKLGGVVESMVKQVKRIITSSIRNNILDYFDFEYLVQETKMLINKRPIAFKSLLNKMDVNDIPSPLTPEMIVKGHDVPCISIIPQLNTSENDDCWDYNDELLSNNQDLIITKFNKLKKVRRNLEKLYKDEFVSNLLLQSTDRKNRYAKKGHTMLKSGDVVSIRTNFSKPFDYPLGVVVRVETNDLNEVTAAHVRKANGEIIRRHVDNLIFIAEMPCNPDKVEDVGLNIPNSHPVSEVRKQREAARVSQERNKKILSNVDNIMIHLGKPESIEERSHTSPVYLDGLQETHSCQACLDLMREWQFSHSQGN